MLATESYTIEGALDELSEAIGSLEDRLDDLDSSTDEYAAVQNQRDRLAYFRNGLEWQRDEEEWGDATIELGALTAGEKAMMHRESPDSAGAEEMRLWFIAASTAESPYLSADLSDTFTALANCHPGFTEWAEGKTNSLGVPGGSGNRSSTSSEESPASPTSTDGQSSTTTSSSDSPTE